MKIEIEISDEEIANLIKDKIAQVIVGDRFSYDKNMYKREIAQAVRDVIYADKENIINMTVNRASKEIKSKAFAKLLSDAEI
jgi:hypothetical protein